MNRIFFQSNGICFWYWWFSDDRIEEIHEIIVRCFSFCFVLLSACLKNKYENVITSRECEVVHEGDMSKRGPYKQKEAGDRGMNGGELRERSGEHTLLPSAHCRSCP